jgi:hypothetical protein
LEIEEFFAGLLPSQEKDEEISRQAFLSYWDERNMKNKEKECEQPDDHQPKVF